MDYNMKINDDGVIKNVTISDEELQKIIKQSNISTQKIVQYKGEYNNPSYIKYEYSERITYIENNIPKKYYIQLNDSDINSFSNFTYELDSVNKPQPSGIIPLYMCDGDTSYKISVKNGDVLESIYNSDNTKNFEKINNNSVFFYNTGEKHEDFVDGDIILSNKDTDDENLFRYSLISTTIISFLEVNNDVKTLKNITLDSFGWISLGKREIGVIYVSKEQAKSSDVNNLVIIPFSTSDFIQSDNFYSLTIDSSQTTFTDNNYIVEVENEDGSSYNTLSDSIIKNADGSLILNDIMTPFNGRILLLGNSEMAIVTPTIKINSHDISISNTNESISSIATNQQEVNIEFTENIINLNSDNTKNKENISNLENNKADKATTLTGYNIGDAYTKTQIDLKLNEVDDNLTILDENIKSLDSDIDVINSKIPNQATSTNQLADKDFVNSSIEQIAANRVTYNVLGDAFPTKQSLLDATVYYFQGQPYTPNEHDYTIVLSDSSAPEPFTNGQVRYEWDGAQWDFAYGVNDRPFTEDEKKVLASEMTLDLTNKLKGIEAGAQVNPDMNLYYTKSAADLLLNDKVDKVTGKGLSTNDYITADKNNVAKIPSLENDLEDKLDKTTTPYQTYLTNNVGQQIIAPYTYSNAPNSIVYRNPDARIKVGDPVDDLEAMNKGTADRLYEEKLNEYDNTDTYNTRITGGYPNELQDGSFAYVDIIKGNSVEQVLSNGDFSNGIIGWQSSSVANYSLSIDVSTSEAIVVPALGKTPTSGGLFQNIQNKNISNKTLFTIVKLGNVEYNNAQTSFYAQVRLESVEIGGNVSKNFNETQSNDILFAKLNHTNYTTKALVVSTSVTSGELLTEMRVKQIMLFDITNLPSTLTDEEIYNLVKDIPYTEGEINTVFSGIEQTGKNLADINAEAPDHYNTTQEVQGNDLIITSTTNTNITKYGGIKLNAIQNNIDYKVLFTYEGFYRQGIIYNITKLNTITTIYPNSNTFKLTDYNGVDEIALFIYLRNEAPIGEQLIIKDLMITLSTADPSYEDYETTTWSLPSAVELKSSAENINPNQFDFDTAPVSDHNGATHTYLNNSWTVNFMSNTNCGSYFLIPNELVKDKNIRASLNVTNITGSYASSNGFLIREEGFGAVITSQELYPIGKKEVNFNYTGDKNLMVFIYKGGAAPSIETCTFNSPMITLSNLEPNELEIKQDYLDVTNEKLYKWNTTTKQYDETPYAITDKSYIVLDNNGTETQTLTQPSIPATITAKYNRNSHLQTNENTNEIIELQAKVKELEEEEISSSDVTVNNQESIDGTATNQQEINMQNKDQIRSNTDKFITKVDKITGSERLYGTDASGNQTSLAYRTNSTGNAVIRRDAYGRAQVTDPITNLDIANQGFVNNKSQPYEANLRWGGKNLWATYSPIDAAMVGTLGANRLAFCKPESISVEYSRDGGSTWVDYEATDTQLNSIFMGGLEARFTIGKADASNPATNNSKLRITLDTKLANVYTVLNKFVVYVSTNGSDGCTIQIQKALGSTPDTYIDHTEKIGIAGWSGYNVINTDSLVTYGNTPGTQYGKVRFLFEIESQSGSTGFQVINIQGFGGVGWAAPSNMAAQSTLYDYDANQNMILPSGLTAKNNSTFEYSYFTKTPTVKDYSNNTVPVALAASLERIESGSLDTRVLPGWYNVKNNGNVANIPTGAGLDGVLQVIPWGPYDPNGTYVTQMYIEAAASSGTNTRMWLRRRSISWGQWVEISNTNTVSKTPITLTDLNTAKTGGFYIIESSGANRPSGASSGTVLVTPWEDIKWCTQTFYNTSSNDIWTRDLRNDVWGSWVKIITSTPTGDLNIEGDTTIGTLEENKNLIVHGNMTINGDITFNDSEHTLSSSLDIAIGDNTNHTTEEALKKLDVTDNTYVGLFNGKIGINKIQLGTVTGTGTDAIFTNGTTKLETDKIDTTDINFTGNINDTISATELEQLNGVTSNVQGQLNSKAPTSHASTATTYGKSTGISYGHVKLSNSVESEEGESDGVAATPKAVSSVYGQLNNVLNTALDAQYKAIHGYVQANNAYNQANAAYNLATTKAPGDHASTTTLYGLGNASNYGHLKLSASTSSSSGTTSGVAATPSAVNSAYGRASSAYNQANSAYTQANSAYGRANSSYTQANNAYNQANAAYNIAANLSAGEVPINHASTTTIYGLGNASNYGHLKLSASTSSSSGTTSGVAATPSAVNSAYSRASSAYTQANNAYNRANLAITQTVNTTSISGSNYSLRIVRFSNGTQMVTGQFDNAGSSSGMTISWGSYAFSDTNYGVGFMRKSGSTTASVLTAKSTAFTTTSIKVHTSYSGSSSATFVDEPFSIVIIGRWK